MKMIVAQKTSSDLQEMIIITKIAETHHVQTAAGCEDTHMDFEIQ